ncbi:hypothetical protein N0V94_008960 [Neodidymelliopsis sp. IMI 364377]|nr:hypothetical protein N0V94_008960 [Neodidymelliopsis sp. IMI 364377]
MEETTCHPKLVKYVVTVSHIAGKQKISYEFRDEELDHKYSDKYQDYNGTFEQWVQFSDALTIYDYFASILNTSSATTRNVTFTYSNLSTRAEPYLTSNNTTVETCVLNAGGRVSIGNKYSLNEEDNIWPLSVFQGRPSPKSSPSCESFDAEVAKDLLINITISALALNKRFDTVNGTESRSFNAYRFQRKLGFFLPYGLALALALPIIACGLVALYMQNQGVSAISGGFLQLLMTTTGRTELERTIVKGSGTMGGYENVSKELLHSEVMFGEFVDSCDEKNGESVTSASILSRPGRESDDPIAMPLDDDRQTVEGNIASGVELLEEEGSVVRRAGFGTIEEVRSFKRKTAS